MAMDTLLPCAARHSHSLICTILLFHAVNRLSLTDAISVDTLPTTTAVTVVPTATVGATVAEAERAMTRAIAAASLMTIFQRS